MYWGAVTSNKLYKITIESIHTFIISKNQSNHNSLSPTLISKNKPISDGLSSDENDNIWITSFASSAIAILQINNNNNTSSTTSTDSYTSPSTNSHKLTIIVQNNTLLRWPDGLSFGPDGLYITNSALHLKLSNTMIGPYHILRIHIDRLKDIFGNEYTLPAAGQ